MTGPTSTGTTTITSIDVHAEGEAGRILLGAHLLVRGATWPERMRWCQARLDWLRRLLLREPRGHPSMCAVLVLPPLDPTADVGIIVLEQGGFRPMSGSNTMCAVTALLETGSLPAAEPETVVRIDTAVGAVEATARVEGGRVRWVRVRNVPSFALALDSKIAVPEYGTISADIAFGGQFYVQARAADMGVMLGPDHAPAIARAGAALLAAAREQVPVAHPVEPDVTQISLVMLHGPADSPGVSGRNSVVLPAGRITADDPASWRGTLDRSPCGTGTCARMAPLDALASRTSRLSAFTTAESGRTLRRLQARGLKHRAQHETRSIPIPPVLVRLLRDHLKRYGTAPDGRIFRTTRGGLIQDSAYSAVWADAHAAALTPAQQASPLAARPYDLRHAGVSLALNAGVPATKVARRAGHSVAVLLKIYAHCIDGQAGAANKRIADALGSDDTSDDQGQDGQAS